MTEAESVESRPYIAIVAVMQPNKSQFFIERMFKKSTPDVTAKTVLAVNICNNSDQVREGSFKIKIKTFALQGQQGGGVLPKYQPP